MKTPEYALVTGASRGLGRAFAQTLAAQRRHLLLVARSGERLVALADELHNSYGIRALPLAWDLSAPQAGQRLARYLQEREIPVDLLVNNAGFGDRGEFARHPAERCFGMVRLNNASLIELTHELLPHMIEAGRGGIINVASTAGFQPIPHAALYAATKSFLITFSLGLAEELRPSSIPVVTLCPGRLKEKFQENGSKTGRRSVPGVYTTPERAVRDALRQLRRGGGLVIPGFLNKFGVAIQRLIPRRAVPGLAGLLSR